MKTPKMSVCVVTARPGGIDVLISGLCRQEFTDFEVVLVDALYHRRKEVVADKFAEAKIELRHIPPRQRLFPIDACPQALNAAIAKARGELLLWGVDYSFFPPKCLSEHWGVYEYFNKQRFGMGAHRYLYPKVQLAYELPSYAPMKMSRPHEQEGVTYSYSEEASRQFASDIEAGVYDVNMYSIFHPPLVSPGQIEILPEDPLFFHADPKLSGLIGGKLSGDFMHCKNESISRQLMLDVNGFNEDFISHLYDDTDVGHRLEHAGAEWVLLDSVATVLIVNPRHMFPHLVRRGEMTSQRVLYESRKSDGACVRSSNQYDLGSFGGVPWWY
ncbi:MAG: hypothetical protein U1B30_06765 [Pseudomonadota bacterium]|nr:hypothetical protein [Pseudomonadota bacterium]